MKILIPTVSASIVASLDAVTTVAATFLVFGDGDDGVQMDTLSTQVAALTTKLATLEAQAAKNPLNTPIVIERICATPTSAFARDALVGEPLPASCRGS